MNIIAGKNMELPCGADMLPGVHLAPTLWESSNLTPGQLKGSRATVGVSPTPWLSTQSITLMGEENFFLTLASFVKKKKDLVHPKAALSSKMSPNI